MIVPYGNPREVLVRSKEIKVGSICGDALPIVIQGVCLTIRQRRTTNARVLLVFISIISKMEDIVDRLFADRTPISVEEALGYGCSG
jgi:hypothetical protein